MVKDLKEKQASWRTIAEEIVADVKAGNNVGFITLGDASVYSTYSYLLGNIDNRITVETVAGISAYTQIAATISTPLMLDDELLEVIPATADAQKIATAIDDNDNVVMMKISANLPLVYQLLADRNLLDQAIIISNASMATQHTVKLSAVEPTEKLPYFSTLLLKKTYSF